MEWIVNNAGDLVTALLSVLGTASVVARLTPTQADDAIIQKVLDFVHLVGLTKLKK